VGESVVIRPDRGTEVVVVADQAALAQEAAERFARTAEERLAEADRFTVALAGGTTPHRLYSVLGSEPYRSRIPWRRIHLFWGDERCVPPDHRDSNYRLVEQTLLRRLPEPPGGVHRMWGEEPDPRRAAADYDRVLAAEFRLSPGGLPRFDLALLGVGRDGHTASLFPGSPALLETSRLAVATFVEHLRAYRLTLTLPVLNEARAILFLVGGRDKAEIVRAVLDSDSANDQLPARRVRPRDGRTTWLIDRAAAALLRVPARNRERR
jgi:6-phosphogluconolactonase